MSSRKTKQQATYADALTDADYSRIPADQTHALYLAADTFLHARGAGEYSSADLTVADLLAMAGQVGLAASLGDHCEHCRADDNAGHWDIVRYPTTVAVVSRDNDRGTASAECGYRCHVCGHRWHCWQTVG